MESLLKWTLCLYIFLTALSISKATTNTTNYTVVDPSDHDSPLSLDKNYFLTRILEQYGDGNSISKSQIQDLLDMIQGNGHGSHDDKDGDEDVVKTLTEVAKEGKSVGDDKQSCSGDDDWLRDEDCLKSKCLTADEIFTIHDVKTDSVNASELFMMSPTLLYAAQNTHCRPAQDQEETPHNPAVAKVWGYGFLCVTVINLCSLMGMVFLPLMQKSFYKRLLMFMVALAVGTLSGSALLFLLPECFEMVGSEHHAFEGYVWKCTTILGGIYMFFLIERLLKNIMDWRKKLSKFESDASSMDITTSSRYEPLKKGDEPSMMENAPISSLKTRDIHRNESMNMSFSIPNTPKETQQDVMNSVSKQLKEAKEAKIKQSEDPEFYLEGNRSQDVESSSGANAVSTDVQPSETYANKLTANDSSATFNYIRPNESSVQLLRKSPDCSSHSSVSPPSTPSDTEVEIRSVAWMVIFGDGLHNFIDGLSIGAAFSKNIMAGVSVSLAVVCEELPHELGDFAILLNSGMSMRQALCYNFLSACMCYAGLALGILVGETTTGSTWIFALAAGMFLYISLVDMLPEVNHAAEQESKSMAQTWKIFFLQNAGLLTGYGIMLLLAVYGDRIDLE